jgi:hypothetical protein
LNPSCWKPIQLLAAIEPVRMPVLIGPGTGVDMGKYGLGTKRTYAQFRLSSPVSFPLL